MASNRLLQADEVEGTLTGRNYITNGNAERNVIGVSAYADTAGAVPVDMTGGSPSATITRTTSSPLRGAGSFLVTKGASNLQGNGVSTPFTIDTCDQAKILTITFDYAVASGTFNFNGASYSSPSDLAVYVYDVTNSVLIYPSNSWLDGSGKFIAQFQTSSNSTSYRVGLHIATTNASAWTFKFDNLKVGASTLTTGAIITDWVSYTPTFSASFGTTTSVNMKWRRVGDSVQIRGRFTTGTTTGSQAQIGLPAGLTTSSTITTLEAAGTATANNTPSTTAFSTFIVAQPSVAYLNLGITSSTVNADNFANANIYGSTITFSLNAQVPITGWSSNMVMSSDYGNRAIVFTGQDSTSGTTLTSNTTTTIPFTKIVDTTGSFSSNTFTVPETGYYQVQAQACTAAVTIGTTGTFYLELWQNGANVRYGAITIGSGGSTNYTATFNATLPFNAGDALIMKGTSSVTTALRTGITGITYMSINKVPNPQTLAGAEIVAFRGTNSALTSIGTSETTVPFTATKDTHGVWSGTGYVVPVSGWYTISSRLLMTVNLSTSQNAYMGIFLDGVAQAYGPNCYGAGVSRAESPTVVGSIYANQGQVISIKSAAGVSTALISAGTNNYLSIVKEN